MRRRSGTLIATASYALLTLVLTWPVARGLASDLPADFGDPLLNSWILAWDADHLLRALSGHVQALGEYWQANIYYPHPLALAYSEHLTAQAVMILPVYAISRNPILSYQRRVPVDVCAVCDRHVPVRARADPDPAAAAFPRRPGVRLRALPVQHAAAPPGPVVDVDAVRAARVPPVFREPTCRAPRRRGGGVARPEPVVRLLPAVLQSGCRALRRARDHTAPAVVGRTGGIESRPGDGGCRDRDRAVPPAVLAASTARIQPEIAGRDHPLLGGCPRVCDRRPRHVAVGANDPRVAEAGRIAFPRLRRRVAVEWRRSR